ncbi:glycosyltransferase family 4 protein [Halalkalibacter alkalisediminis]|uniref:Glycosyltransferase family 4 protein n=1 Tax=Halalkalibacter alkalisediminis TaxID=935616 RepID=A0ABV6NJA4_9BACI|nr:glycosyltransferase family 4 protein [Halalkalibacter alkalisediminis]
MNILHICSYYIGNQLYKNMVKELSTMGVNQHVFIPIKNKSSIGKNQLLTQNETIKYYYSNILNKYDRYLYLLKINKQLKEIEKSILSNESIDFVHAHTVFSDGGTAYQLYEKYGINYMVTVRNTDINRFYKYWIPLRPYMYKILLNARKVVFISHAYKKQMFSLLPAKVVSQIKSKCIVIPNGIDKYWHKESKETKVRKDKLSEINLLFIGMLNKNKNLKSVLLTCAKLCEQGYNAKLKVVGNGPLEDDFRSLTKELNIDKNVEFHGYITDKKSIKSIIDECDVFIMPSFKETFGLVYIEAMSRGLPVLYSKGQGIDGFFEEGEIGYSVDPLNIEAMVNAIVKIIVNYPEMSNNCIKKSKVFTWHTICGYYYKLYTNNNKVSSGF